MKERMKVCFLPSGSGGGPDAVKRLSVDNRLKKKLDGYGNILEGLQCVGKQPLPCGDWMNSSAIHLNCFFLTDIDELKSFPHFFRAIFALLYLIFDHSAL
jgi:hypothetical protein